MPANIHQPAANSPAEWYHSLPPITKLYGTVCVAATVLSLLGLLNPMQLYLSWPLIFGKLQVRSGMTQHVLPPLYSSFLSGRYLTRVPQCVNEASSAIQIWRLVTCFIFLGKPSFAFLLRLLWM